MTVSTLSNRHDLERPRLTAALLTDVASSYGMAGSVVRDLGGSYSLNVLVDDHVVRVYRRGVSVERVREMQRIRELLRGAEIPTAELRRAMDDASLIMHAGHVVEVERFVDGHTDWMESPGQMLVAMRFLGHVHSAMRDMSVVVPPPMANHLPEADAIAAVRAAARVLRSRELSAAEERYVSAAEQLAQMLPVVGLPEQVVHGDFKDNNVLFRDDHPACLLDFDFCGVRARIDDLALPIHYELQIEVAALDDARRWVDEYDAGLDDHLTASERSAFPAALARMPLAHFVHLALPGWEDRRVQLVESRGPACEWWLTQLGHLERWQATFA